MLTAWGNSILGSVFDIVTVILKITFTLAQASLNGGLPLLLMMSGSQKAIFRNRSPRRYGVAASVWGIFVVGWAMFKSAFCLMILLGISLTWTQIVGHSLYVLWKMGGILVHQSFTSIYPKIGGMVVIVSVIIQLAVMALRPLFQLWQEAIRFFATTWGRVYAMYLQYELSIKAHHLAGLSRNIDAVSGGLQLTRSKIKKRLINEVSSLPRVTINPRLEGHTPIVRQGLVVCCGESMPLQYHQSIMWSSEGLPAGQFCPRVYAVYPVVYHPGTQSAYQAMPVSNLRLGANAPENYLPALWQYDALGKYTDSLHALDLETEYVQIFDPRRLFNRISNFPTYARGLARELNVRSKLDYLAFLHVMMDAMVEWCSWRQRGPDVVFLYDIPGRRIVGRVIPALVMGDGEYMSLE